MSSEYIKLPTKNPNAPKYAYIANTTDANGRKQTQNAWKFRLNAEFLNLKKKGWNIAFCTLTYRDKNLPKIPKICFKNPENYTKINCFSKSDIQNWIHGVRQYFKYHNNFTNGNNIRYFIASEYGSNTHRPHYHAILAWPNTVDYKTMHTICTEKWKNGFMFPRNVNGDKAMFPFKIIGDASRAINYVAKYACKDIDYEDITKTLNLKKNLKIYKNCCSFHLQSKSLGFEFIKNMTDEEKHNVFVNGISFQGDGLTYRIPIYIKNRIIFDNYYIINEQTGKRLVRRKASKFFEKYKSEIFKEKARFYEKLFKDSLVPDYFIRRGLNEEQAQKFSNALTYYKNCVNSAIGFDVFGSGVFSQYYMCYFGIDRKYCKSIHSFNDALNQWMRRYKEPQTLEVINNNEQINQTIWQSIQNFSSMVLGCNTFCNLLAMQQQEKNDRLNKKIQDYFNNVLKQRLLNAI